MPSTACSVDRLARKCAVEIDDVKIFETQSLEFDRLRDRVDIENGRLVHVAMDQADTFAILEVDSGKQNHGDHRRKLAMSLSPSDWLFSGWNWVPTILSRPIMAVSAPP